MKVVLILLFPVIIHLTDGLFRKNLFPSVQLANTISGDTGEPLFLTKYIKSGKINEARRLSQVGPLPNGPNITSYSGFFTVNQNYNSNLFFWFFPSLINAVKAPTLVWLQGGPGGSSLFGLFVENGPLVITKDLNAKLRKYTWALDYNVIYFDNPVGTGFSFTKNDLGYANNESDVARDLYEALQQFFTVFHEYKTTDLYITGESYAGKYVPAIAYKIHSEGSNSGLNLKGIAIGDGLCDPESQSNYGDYLFQIGLLDEKQLNLFKKEEAKGINYIKNKQYYEAFKVFDQLMDGDLINGSSYFYQFTGLKNYYNYLLATEPDDFNYYSGYIGLKETRRAIHVGNLTYNQGNIVEQHLINDIFQSVKPWFEVLMNNYKVLVYSGQLDIIVAAPLTESFVNTMNWKYANEYKNADRLIWKVSPEDTEVAGYVRQVHDFYQIIVRNAGHILPYDQPRVAYDMIRRFINNQGFKK